jgi:hypothetical protein
MTGAILTGIAPVLHFKVVHDPAAVTYQVNDRLGRSFTPAFLWFSTFRTCMARISFFKWSYRYILVNN